MEKLQKTGNRNIAKNTLFLYCRTLYSIAISLFTARIILNALGATDFGIYNVIGSVVTIFIFLRAAMSNSTHRFITFALGEGDFKKLNHIFSTTVAIHLFISSIIVLLSETIGLWFFYNKIIIPYNRIQAAFWCYQFSVITCALSVICVPYDATLIAHEKFEVFAGVQIFTSTMNLVIAFFLTITNTDRLFLYGLLLMGVQVVNRLFYGFYCSKRFKECHFKLFKDTNLIKEMTSFAGWSLIGNLSVIGYTQGINILLNMFFGPVINAAVGIAHQIQSAMKNLVSSFQTAVNPQITKSYASGEINRLHNLLFSSSKFSFYLLLCMYLPVFLEAEIILKIWLGDVPKFTIVFLRLILLITLIDTLSNPIGVANNATGKIKVYQIIEGGLLLLILPVSYFFLSRGYNPETVFLVQLAIYIITQFARIELVKSKLFFSLKQYTTQVLLPVCSVLIVSALIPLIAFFYSPKTFLGLLFVTSISVFSVLATAFIFGLSNKEKMYICEKTKKIRIHS